MAFASKKAKVSGQPALLRAMSDAVLAMTAAHQVERVLQLLAESARELAGARYAAIGIPDDEGGFAAFIHTGMSDELVAQIAAEPRPTRGHAVRDGALPHTGHP